MTRGDLIELWNVLEVLADLPGHPKFAYAVAKNRAIMRAEVEAIEKARIQWPKDYDKFEGARVRLCSKFAKKDEAGNPLEHMGRFVLDPERKNQFKKKMDALTEKFAEACEAFVKHRTDYNAFLGEPFDTPEFRRVKVEFLPEGITARQIETLSPILLDA